ncbi:MAG TPA: hypothetical protein PK313_08590 [Myxococcota bacterium]|mgnify:CR=1 FL=1|jgi:hypothetical protein|nr:hypothetical protein [Myxococcota bacterium]
MKDVARRAHAWAWLPVLCLASCSAIKEPWGTPGVLGAGRFVASCDDVAPWWCDGSPTSLAVGTDVSLTFEAFQAIGTVDVVTVSAGLRTRPMRSALVAFVRHMLVDFVNVRSEEVREVTLETCPEADDDSPISRGSCDVGTTLHVGFEEIDPDPERLYLVPRNADGRVLAGTLPWTVRVEPAIAQAAVQGNHLVVQPIAGPGTWDASLIVELRDPARSWAWDLRVRVQETPPPQDVFEAGETVDDAEVGDDLDMGQEVPVDDLGQEPADAPVDAPYDAPADAPYDASGDAFRDAPGDADGSDLAPEGDA